LFDAEFFSFVFDVRKRRATVHREKKKKIK
jgi:hypothetical protein